MKRTLWLAAPLVFFTHAASAEAVMTPGNWEIVMKNIAESPEPFITTQCMTAEDLQSQVLIADDEVPPEQRGKDYDISGDDGDCAYQMSHRAGKLHIRTDCGGEISTTDVTYTAETFTMTSHVEAEGEKTLVEMNGRRVGECVPEADEPQENQ